LSRRVIIAVIAVVIVAVAVVYAVFDPASAFFPRCVFRSLTGLECPGCGSQRALHALLTGHPAEAAALNPLVVAASAVLPLYAAAEWWPDRWPRLTRALRSRASCLTLAGVIVGWWILRNII